MLDRSLVEMVKGRLREFRREPSAMFFVFLMPLLWMVVLGLAFSRPDEGRYGVALLKSAAHSSAPACLTLEAVLQHSPAVDVLQGDELEVRTWMQRGKAVLSLECGPEGTIVYHFDPRHREAKLARSVVNDLVQAEFGRHDVVVTKDQVEHRLGQRYIDLLVPGLLALSLLTTSLFGTGMTLVAQRKENLLKRFRVTPMSPYGFFASYIIARIVIMALEMMVIGVTGWLLFRTTVNGSLLAFMGVGVVATAAFTALSILLGARMNNTSAYNGFTNLLVLPMMMLGGIWFSRGNFPGWVNSVVDYLPLTLCVDALRKIALEGAGFGAVQREVLVLGVYGVVCSLGAKKLFKWY